MSELGAESGGDAPAGDGAADLSTEGSDSPAEPSSGGSEGAIDAGSDGVPDIEDEAPSDTTPTNDDLAEPEQPQESAQPPEPETDGIPDPDAPTGRTVDQAPAETQQDQSPQPNDSTSPEAAETVPKTDDASLEQATSEAQGQDQGAQTGTTSASDAPSQDTLAESTPPSTFETDLSGGATSPEIPDPDAPDEPAANSDHDEIASDPTDAGDAAAVEPTAEIPPDPSDVDNDQEASTDVLSEASQDFSDNRLDTPAGEAFYEPADYDMQNAAKSVPPESGTFTADLHGDPDHVYVGDRAHSPEDFADYLRSNDSGWNGEPVRLFSCETGQGQEPFAQRLADNLGTDVTAPDQLAWSESGGATYASSIGGYDGNGDPFPTHPPDGNWITFHPRKDS